MKKELLEKVYSMQKNLIVDGDISTGKTTSVLFPLVDKMIEQGLIQEVKNIKEKYNEFPTAMQGLGYKEVVQYLENKCTYEEMVEKIKQESRRYAKRQITWFKAIKELIWLKAEDGIEKNIEIILEEIN